MIEPVADRFLTACSSSDNPGMAATNAARTSFPLALALFGDSCLSTESPIFASPAPYKKAYVTVFTARLLMPILSALTWCMSPLSTMSAYLPPSYRAR